MTAPLPQSARGPALDQTSWSDSRPPAGDPCQASLVRTDQARRWRQGERVRLEDYLRDLPGLAPAQIVDLAYAEFVLREEVGDTPAEAEYLARFPAHAVALGRVLRLHRLLGEGGLSASLLASAPEPTRPVGAEDLSGGGLLIPGYEVERLLGRGGMGAVYLARQVRFNRPVALKVLLAGPTAHLDDVVRFGTEVEAVARLNHPGIVQVYDTGEWQPRPLEGPQGQPLPFLAMEYCSGGTLAAALAGTPQPPAFVARLLLALTDAVAAAHAAGVVHRDLKPANVLLTGGSPPGAEPLPLGGSTSGGSSRNSGAGHRAPLPFTPKIADFGLAKSLDDNSAQTRTGAVVGTPSYMSPEQAEGRKDVGPLADVYSLGVILYECLTGRPPLRGATVVETLDLVRTREPVSPRSLNPAVPRDLETICLKCLQKDPARRYASARDLGADLARWLAREPILARPISPVERGVRWCLRHRAISALVAVTALAALTFVGLGVWFTASLDAERVNREAEAARADAAQARADASRLIGDTQRYFGLVGRVRERLAQGEAGWAHRARGELTEAARLSPPETDWPELRSLAAACRGATDLDPPTALAPGLTAHCVAWHPDGVQLALGELVTARFLCQVRLVRRDRPAESRALPLTPRVLFGALDRPDRVNALAFSQDGRWLAAGMRHGDLWTWDLSGPAPKVTSRLAHQAEVKRIVFAPDGRAAYTLGADCVRRWSLPDWKPGPRVAAPPDAVRGFIDLDWHPAGWLACSGGFVHRLHPDTLAPVAPPLKVPHAWLLQATPDGRALVLEGACTIGLFDLRAGRMTANFTAPNRATAHDGVVRSLALASDGTLLASTDNETKHLRLWDVASGRLRADVPLGSGIMEVAFSPDGSHLAVTVDRQTLVFPVVRGDARSALALQPRPHVSFALHPDGRSVATAGPSFLEDHGAFGWWPLDPEAELTPRLELHTHNDQPDDPRPLDLADTRLAFDHPASRQATITGLAGPAPGAITAGDCTDLRFGPDARLWGCFDIELRVWSPPGQGRPTRSWRNALGMSLTGRPQLYAVAPGPRHVAVAGRDGSLRVFSAREPLELLRSVAVASLPLRCVSQSPGRQGEEGDEAVVGSDGGEVAVVGLAAGQVLGRVKGHRDRVQSVAWSASGLIASGSRDGDVKLWTRSPAGLRELFSLPHVGPVSRLAFFPDGVRLAVLIQGERAVRVWHLDRLWAGLSADGLTPDLPAVTAVPAPRAVDFTPPAPPGPRPAAPNGLRAVIHDAPGPVNPVAHRVDPRLDFTWMGGALDPAVKGLRCSATWNGWLKAPKPGAYRVGLERTGAARLYLDGRLLIDGFSPEPQFHHWAPVELTAAPREVRVEYVQLGDAAGVRLWWQAPGGAEEIVPASALFPAQPR